MKCALVIADPKCGALQRACSGRCQNAVVSPVAQRFGPIVAGRVSNRVTHIEETSAGNG